MANHETKSCSYDVFLSFRGEDTRHSFTGHLYDALCREGINTFMDDEQLRRGEQIAPALLKAIEESTISIIVFSENYAASTWCLDELVKILECKKENSQLELVWPIFYKVEPSDVRNQKKSYGNAITVHETRFGNDSEKVRKWRTALSEVSNLTGDHFKEGYEYKFIREVVTKASVLVSPKDLDINEHIVGLDDRVEELKSLLEIESHNTACFLGIYGTGGIGKTTLAKALYNSIYKQFEAACFLFSVRETWNQLEGQKRLQQTLLSEILEEEKIPLESVNKGTKTIKRRLGRKRVLVVLDDVDDIEQLKILAGGRDWFGFGSRIIITTRDQHWLDVYQVEKRYEMKVLNERESLELFCQNAFKTKRPASNYEDLSNCAMRYAKGLPLALKVIGSNLIGQDVDGWTSALDKYENNPNRDIQRTLRISYDSLDLQERNIFLDIACFFKGQRLEYVKRILKACDFYPESGIKRLVDKSLITVEYGCLRMHDLIQIMGKEIVKEEAPEEVGERSRVWFHEDARKVLKGKTGSSKIQGIMLDPPEMEEINWIHRAAFAKMENLRILIVRDGSYLRHFSCGPNYLPNQLRLFEWSGYPSRFLPRGFNPTKIAVFNIRSSPLLLERPFQIFENLTYMTISYCGVTQFPDVSVAKNLRELRLDKCMKLVTVHESVGSLRNLVYLRVSECPQLRRFLPRFYLPSLEYLSFNFCRRLAHFPDIVGKMDKPLKITMIDTAIKELPHSVGKLTGLNYLEMTICKGLQDLPSSLFMLPNFVTLKIGGCSRLPGSFRRFQGSHLVAACRPNLGTLHFGYAGLSDEDLDVIIHSFPNLKDLNVSRNNFVSFPARIKESVYVTSLDVSYCVKLEEIPELPPSVKKVDATGCCSLTLDTLRMLWSQVCKEINRLEVKMPCQLLMEEQEGMPSLEEIEEIEEPEAAALQEIVDMIIPKWFDRRNKGGIPVFKARRKFPVVALAFVFEKGNARPRPKVPLLWPVVGLHLFIEGEHVHRRQYHNFTVARGHVLLCDLRVLFSEEEWEGLDARVGHGRDWKTVQVDCETNLTLSFWGIYVYKQETNMEDIQFTSPDPSSSGTCKPRSSVPTSQEEKVWNKIESWNLPALYDKLLMDHEEFGCFKYVSERYQVIMLAALGRMSRRVMAQREGEGTSGLKLEDDEDVEDDWIWQQFVECLETMSDDDEMEWSEMEWSEMPSCSGCVPISLPLVTVSFLTELLSCCCCMF